MIRSTTLATILLIGLPLFVRASTPTDPVPREFSDIRLTIDADYYEPKCTIRVAGERPASNDERILLLPLPAEYYTKETVLEFGSDHVSQVAIISEKHKPASVGLFRGRNNTFTSDFQLTSKIPEGMSGYAHALVGHKETIRIPFATANSANPGFTHDGVNSPFVVENVIVKIEHGTLVSVKPGDHAEAVTSTSCRIPFKYIADNNGNLEVQIASHNPKDLAILAAMALVVVLGTTTGAIGRTSPRRAFLYAAIALILALVAWRVAERFVGNDAYEHIRTSASVLLAISALHVYAAVAGLRASRHKSPGGSNV